MRHFYYRLKPPKAGILMIVLSFIFLLSLILMMLTSSFHHQQLANREVKHYFQRQMMKQLLLADYQKNPTKYDKEGVVNYNIGQILYQGFVLSLVIVVVSSEEDTETFSESLIFIESDFK